METTLNLVSIIIIVFGILQIMLFFKLWGMTNDISEIKDVMKLFLKNNIQNKTKESESIISDNSAQKTESQITPKEDSKKNSVEFTWQSWVALVIIILAVICYFAII